MSRLFASAPAIPIGGGGYVIAAYLVVLVLILLYVVIMATRAQRVERELARLRKDVEAARRDDNDADRQTEAVA